MGSVASFSSRWCRRRAAGLLPAPAAPPALDSPSWPGSSSVSHVQPTPVPPECFGMMFCFTSSKTVEGSTSFVLFLMNPGCCAHRGCTAPFRPHVASAFPFNEVLFWAEDREATPIAGQLHHFMQAEEAHSVPGEQLGLARAGCPPAGAHLTPPAVPQS